MPLPLTDSSSFVLFLPHIGKTLWIFSIIKSKDPFNSGSTILSSGLAGVPDTPLRLAGITLFKAAAKSPLPRIRRLESSSRRVVDSYTYKLRTVRDGTVWLGLRWEWGLGFGAVPACLLQTEQNITYTWMCGTHNTWYVLLCVVHTEQDKTWYMSYNTCG